MYGKCERTEKNLKKILYWYQKAAEKGNIDAQYMLAILYKEGLGTEKNLEKAFYWYHKAAEKENIDAQYNFTLLYYKRFNFIRYYIKY